MDGTAIVVNFSYLISIEILYFFQKKDVHVVINCKTCICDTKNPKRAFDRRLSWLFKSV